MTASPLAPVIASFLCWRAGVGVADGVGTGAGVVDGVGVGTGVADGVVDGLGVDVGSGVGAGDVDGVADGLGSGVVLGVGSGDVDGVGLGLGDADGVGVGVTGVGVGLGLGVGLGADGLGLGVGVGVGTTGLVSNPALPPDSRRMIRAATSQDLSWEVILATSRHGPGSVALTLTLSWKRAFSPLSNLTLMVALVLSQLTTSGSMYLVYIG